MQYVITCGDEGVQINEGIRLAVVGAGYRLDGFSQIVKILKKQFGPELNLAASEENDWIKRQLDLSNWEQVNASAQQHLQALADQEGLIYVGNLPFADPQELVNGIKGHMVRPHAVHIATKICFTFGGGEQTYHLGQYLISAEWVNQAPRELVEAAIKTQVDFYQSLGSTELGFSYQIGGALGEQVALQNKAIIEQLGYKLA